MKEEEYQVKRNNFRPRAEPNFRAWTKNCSYLNEWQVTHLHILVTLPVQPGSTWKCPAACRRRPIP